ncbi:TPA: DUF551 domain-containing protein [Klebsiella quasipneumoniae subsp. quasipneumoniae]|nr:DUF551 domain-containing protein [Klebsiella quasipneumoniae subsp. quasipneumoniae]
MTSKLTRERLAEIAQFGFSSAITPANDFEIKELARIALAAMNGEPFAYIIQDKYERERGVEGHLSRSHVSKYVSQEDINEHEITCIPLYRHAQTAPVVPDERDKAVDADDHPLLWSFNEGWNACRAAMLAAAPQSPGSDPATVPGKWIPVSERMPDENAEQQVLACFKGGDISTLYYFEGCWDDAYGIVPIRQDVTHWMPLPAAPQEVKDGK